MHYGQGPPGSPMDDFGRYRNGDNGSVMMAGGGQNMFGQLDPNGQYQVQEGEEVDVNGRVTRGPITLKNGAEY